MKKSRSAILFNLAFFTVLFLSAQAPQWKIKVSGFNLNEVFMLNTTTGWAVGNSGEIWHTTDGGSNWELQHSGTTSLLNGVWASDANNAWAVGQNGIILKWNGTDWQSQTSGTAQFLSDIWGLNANAIWAVGASGTMLKWDGVSWQTQNLGISNSLYSVHGSSATNVWAVGSSGKVLRWDGSNWLSPTSGETNPLESVWAYDANNVWVTVNGNKILKWGGAGFVTSKAQIFGTPALWDIHGTATNQIWAVGASGFILQWNGSSWQTIGSGTSLTLNAVFGVNASNAWAVGEGGTILKWNGTDWLKQTPSNKLRLNAVHGYDANNVWAVGDGGIIFKWNGSDWLPQISGTGENLYGVWAHDATNVFAVGANGVALKWNGSVWAAHDAISFYDFNAIWGLDTNNVWAVGLAGFLRKWNGTGWQVENTATSWEQCAVGGVDATHVWAAGGSSFGSSMQRWNGSNWSQNATGSSYIFRALWAADINNVWAVGDFGTVYKWNGSAWSNQSLGGSTYRAATGTDANHVWLSGVGGKIMFWNGGCWQQQSTGTPVELRGIWAVDATHAWAVGNGGQILYFENNTPAAPAMSVEGNNTLIADGSISASVADSTAFGAHCPGGTPVSHTFTVKNDCSATGNLTLTGITSGNSLFTISGTGSFPIQVVPGQSATFKVNFTRTGSGSSTISIANNDADNNPYTFVVSGDAVDQTPPVITCPTNKTVSADANCSGTVGAWNLISKNDNCTASGSISQSQSPANNTILSGHNDAETVTLTADDGNGNTQSCQFAVTLKDVTKPVIQCPANQTVNADASCSGTVGAWSLISKNDNCTPSANISQGQSPANNTVLIGHNDAETVTLTAADGNGNTQSCQFTVTLKDVTTPVITCPDNLTVEPTVQAPCSATPAGLNAAIVENCDPILTYTLSGATTGNGNGHVSGLVFNAGTTVVNYQVADAGANSSGCSFSVMVNACVVNIIGAVIWENDDATGVGNVSMTLTGDENGSMTTTADGNYSFLELSGHNFVLTPTKTMNKLNGVSVADITRIQQHISGSNPFIDLYKLVAADVNKSNSVTTQDATIIHQSLLGNPVALAQFKTSWRFVPIAHPMSNPPWGFPEKITLTDVSGEVPGQDFYGIKTGDVITPSTNPANFGSPEVLEFVLNAPDQALEAGTQVTVAFSANQFSDLAALQFVLQFDVEKLSLAEIQPLAGLPFSEENFGTYHVSEGAINVVWSQAEGVFVEESAPVFQLIFNVLEAGGILSEVLFLSDEVLPGHAYTATLTDHSIQLNFFGVTSANDPAATQPRIELLQNRPNPFTGTTTIGFVLPEGCEAQLRVFDASGRVLFSQKKNYAAGRHEETLDLEGASGVLWYELATPFGILTKKMVAAEK